MNGCHILCVVVRLEMYCVNLLYLLQSEKESLKRDLQATRHALYNQIQHNRCHNHHHDGTEDQVSP